MRIQRSVRAGLEFVDVTLGELECCLLYPRHDVSRLNQNHVDAERIGLIAQGIAQPFERMLAAAVRALYRRRQQARDRTHHEDAAAAALAHVRQDRLGYPHDAEQIRFELTT